MNANCTLSHSENKIKKSTLIQFLPTRYADQVFVGDEVLVERNDKVMNAKVINVSSEILQGNEKCQLFASIFMSLHNIFI